MKRKYWYANLSGKNKATLNAAVDALGVNGGEPLEGEDGSFIIPVREGYWLSGLTMTKIAAHAPEFQVKPLAIHVYFGKTETVLQMQRDSKSRMDEREEASIKVTVSDKIPKELRPAAAIAARQMAKVMPGMKSREVTHGGTVSFISELGEEGFLWSEVSELLRALSAFRVSVSCAFVGAKALEISLDM